jgi:hypothetical protein
VNSARASDGALGIAAKKTRPTFTEVSVSSLLAPPFEVVVGSTSHTFSGSESSITVVAKGQYAGGQWRISSSKQNWTRVQVPTRLLRMRTTKLRRAPRGAAKSPFGLPLLVAIALCNCGKDAALLPFEKDATTPTQATAPTEATPAPSEEPEGSAVGEEPAWTRVGDLGECPVRKLERPDAWPSFRWKPCPEGYECELAEFTELHGEANQLHYEASVSTHEGQMLVVSTSFGISFVANTDGTTLLGLRSNGRCNIAHAHLWAGSFGCTVSIDQQESNVQGLVLAEHPFETFELVLAPESPVGGGATAALGSSYWVQGWTPVDRLYALDLKNPTAFVELARNDGDIIGTAWSVTSWNHFYFPQLVSGAPNRSRIMRTDGTSAGVPFVEYPDRSAGALAFTETEAAWAEASGEPEDQARDFEEVNIWASPWGADDAELKPRLVARAPAKLDKVPLAATAGYGYYAAGTRDVDLQLVHFVTDLEAGEIYTERFPMDQTVFDPIGISETHVYYRALDAALVRTPRRRVAG